MAFNVLTDRKSKMMCYFFMWKKVRKLLVLLFILYFVKQTVFHVHNHTFVSLVKTYEAVELWQLGILHLNGWDVNWKLLHL